MQLIEQAEPDRPIMLDGIAWRIVVSDGPVTDAAGATTCAHVNPDAHIITIDRNTPRHLMPFAVARAIEAAMNTNTEGSK